MASCGNTILKMGSRGPCVKVLNEMLIARGALAARDIQVMDYLGPPSSVAVREFQASSGLVVDAIVGPKTWAALGVAVNAANAVATTSGGPSESAMLAPGGGTVAPPQGLVDRLKQGFAAMPTWQKWAVVGGGLVATLFTAYALSTKKSVSLSGFLEFVNDEEGKPEKCGRTPSEGTLDKAEDILPEA